MYCGGNNVAANAEQADFLRSTQAAAARQRWIFAGNFDAVSSGVCLLPDGPAKFGPARTRDRDCRPRPYKPARQPNGPAPERTGPGYNWWERSVQASARIP